MSIQPTNNEAQKTRKIKRKRNHKPFRLSRGALFPKPVELPTRPPSQARFVTAITKCISRCLQTREPKTKLEAELLVFKRLGYDDSLETTANDYFTETIQCHRIKYIVRKRDAIRAFRIKHMHHKLANAYPDKSKDEIYDLLAKRLNKLFPQQQQQSKDEVVIPRVVSRVKPIVNTSSVSVPTASEFMGVVKAKYVVVVPEPTAKMPVKKVKVKEKRKQMIKRRKKQSQRCLQLKQRRSSAGKAKPRRKTPTYTVHMYDERKIRLPEDPEILKKQQEFYARFGKKKKSIRRQQLGTNLRRMTLADVRRQMQMQQDYHTRF